MLFTAKWFEIPATSEVIDFQEYSVLELVGELGNKEDRKLSVHKVTGNQNTFQSDCIKMSAFPEKKPEKQKKNHIFQRHFTTLFATLCADAEAQLY